MKFTIDHDYHIHSYLSSCSSDPLQLPPAILAYAVKNGMRNICLTDHFWDETVPGASRWYQPQNFHHIAAALPLPQAEGVAFHFGCETDMDIHCTLGVAQATMPKFDFIIVPTTHLHMNGFTIEGEEVSLEERARRYVQRYDALLAMPVPSGRTGIAHLTCSLIAPKEGRARHDHLKILDMVTDEQFIDLFTRTREKDLGVELNFPFASHARSEWDSLLRPYRLARKCGCKFYLGSDAHTNRALAAAPENFAAIIEALELTEEDKYRPFG